MPFDPNDLTWATNAAVPDLTATVGSADGVIDDVGATHNQAILNNNFKELQVAVNAILAALRNGNIISG